MYLKIKTSDTNLYRLVMSNYRKYIYSNSKKYIKRPQMNGHVVHFKEPFQTVNVYNYFVTV